MNRRNSDKRLFDERYEKMIIEKYAKLSRHAWPSGAVYILDSLAKREREILEKTYAKYPEGSHRKHIKKDILSLDNHKFWGAWAELRLYDWISSRGLEMKPEPILGEGKPDYSLKYPIGKNTFNKLILEVTAVSAESQMKQREEKRIKQLLAKLNEIAVQTNYLFRVHISVRNLPLPTQINYSSLQKSFINQLNNIKAIQNAKIGFICQTENVKIGIEILGKLIKKTGYIDGYSLGLEDEEEESKKFTKRIYDKILEKIGKYEEIDKLKKSFIVVIFVKDIFPIRAFEKALSDIVSLEKESDISSCRRLSGILLYETFAHREKDGSYTIGYFSTFYPYPNARYPADDYFVTLIDNGLDIDGAKDLISKILNGEFTLP